MRFFRDSDKLKARRQKQESAASDKSKPMDFELAGLEESDIEGDLRGGRLNLPPVDGKVRIFGIYSEDQIHDMLNDAGVFAGIADKGYADSRLELHYLSELDQRIFIKSGDEILVHIRLKVSMFRFRLHPGQPQMKLMYIDWLLTRHPRSRHIRPQRLFPGQEAPGLGCFNQIADFITSLALGVGARGAFNIPEYFHDAVLFHRRFNFYDPVREAFFRGIIRDLRRHGAREISQAFSDGRILNQDNEPVEWRPGEMISVLNEELDIMTWSQDYYTRVVRELKRIRFRLAPADHRKSAEEGR
ncbi:MAG: hypothetical protein K1X75_09920 [Leptospirales bacterium]|nr:hypothetical protein [Leptospirales bacterium]